MPSDVWQVQFGRLWYDDPNAINCVKHYSRSHDAVIFVYGDAGNVIETHAHAVTSKSGEFTFFIVGETLLGNIAALDRRSSWNLAIN
jgi:hypothetical protein